MPVRCFANQIPSREESALYDRAVVAGIGSIGRHGDWEYAILCQGDAERSMRLTFPNGFEWKHLLGLREKQPELLVQLIRNRVSIALKLDAAAGIAREQSAEMKTAYSTEFQASDDDLRFTAEYEEWIKGHVK